MTLPRPFDQAFTPANALPGLGAGCAETGPARQTQGD